MIDTENRVRDWDFKFQGVPADATDSSGDDRPLSLLGLGTWIGLLAGASVGFLKVPPYLREALGWSPEACLGFGFAAALALGSTGAVLGCVAWHGLGGRWRRLMAKRAAKGR